MTKMPQKTLRERHIELHWKIAEAEAGSEEEHRYLEEAKNIRELLSCAEQWV